MSIFLPTKYYKDIYSINYELLKSKGIKCILFDLDNTLVPFKEKNPNDDLSDLFKKLINDGFKVIIFTNAKYNRIKPFIDLGVDYNCNSLKPLRYNFKRIIKKYNYSLDEVCIIGDQLYTDILGGNRVGIMTILVTPLSRDDFLITKFLRFLEIKTMNHFEKKGLFKREKYDE